MNTLVFYKQWGCFREYHKINIERIFENLIELANEELLIRLSPQSNKAFKTFLMYLKKKKKKFTKKAKTY